MHHPHRSPCYLPRQGPSVTFNSQRLFLMNKLTAIHVKHASGGKFNNGGGGSPFLACAVTRVLTLDVGYRLRP